MAESALAAADEVLFVLPRVFPHKEYAGAGFADRLELLRAALSSEPRFSLASSSRGLFIELAREARREYGHGVELFLLCGRDAAERIVAWDYSSGESIEKQLETYQLLVASRGGPYTPPGKIGNRVRSLPLPPGVAGISSTEVRARLRTGQPWRHLVPPAVAERMELRLDLWRSE